MVPRDGCRTTYVIREGHITGIDQDEGKLQLAREDSERHRLDNVT